MGEGGGIDLTFRDARGRQRTLSPETAARLADLVGEPCANAAAVVTRPGEHLQLGRGTLHLEDGDALTVRGRLPEGVPLGYHRFETPGGVSRSVIVSPGRCASRPGWPEWGWAVQLFALRSRRSWGIGDLADLRRLGSWSAREFGAGFLLLNPLAAVAPTLPQQPSPYFPASRRFRNPIYLAIEEVPGALPIDTDLARLAAAGRALNAARVIDRDAVWALKRAALERIWAATRGGAEFDRWMRTAPLALELFATWCSLADRFGSDWRSWPPAYRLAGTPAVGRFARDHRERVRFHAWLQWLIERQLGRAAGRLSLIHDLPVGVDPAGADAWEWQDVLAKGVTIGAPPDVFNAKGQDWGILPFHPFRLQARGYQPFIETIRAAMRFGGGLRIDHVMGLFRLWWIPAPAAPAAGGYVRYPARDLLDIVALESHRAEAAIIGEDLGTVEERTREEMAAHNLLSYRLLWFEKRSPSRWPVGALAAVSTHDLPTVAGMWTGSDLEAQQRLGLHPNRASTLAIRRRLARTGGLDPGASAQAAVLAAHRLLAAAPSVMRAASLDDAMAVADRPNMPGSGDDRPNWSLALPLGLDQLRRHPLARRLASLLAEAVGAPIRPRPGRMR
ncbi:MAG TPA: 4-alpha-glucanotransferase [Verrucomicrobiae bacterium]|nr:4-alpha-glucanotransferase [Verrucomicrobiae bacterium]